MIENLFHQTIQKFSLCEKTDTILVAVSGGKDSMALLNLFFEAGYDIHVAHFNFQLRGIEADLDQQLVEEYCKERAIPFSFQTANTKKYAIDRGISTQMAARALRYDWFKVLMQENNIRLLATAHQANDNLETLLYNITKGTGPKGLMGIPVKTHHIIRPLLEITAEEIVNYLTEKGIQWREDRSNQENDYSRNRIRNQVVPELKIINPGLEHTIIHNIERFRYLNEIIEDQLEVFVSKLVKDEQNIKIPHILIQKTKGIGVILEIFLKDYGFNFHDIRNLSDIHHPGKMILSASHRLVYEREYWSLSPLNNSLPPELLIDGPGEYFYQGIKIKVTIITLKPPVSELKNPKIGYFDATTIKWPLRLRLWKEGDKFQPYGMKGNKLISDYLKDLKMDSYHKNQQLILEDQDRIIWLVRQRINEKNKIHPETGEILSILFEK